MGGTSGYTLRCGPTSIIAGKIYRGTWNPLLVETVMASLWKGKVPASLRGGIIRPMFKKISLDADSLVNYHPVSSLPVLGKVAEKVLVRQLWHYLESSDFLHPFQSGFAPGYGTETVLGWVEDLLLPVDKGQVPMPNHLDLPAASDTVGHEVALTCLRTLAGVDGVALEWFRSFL